MVGPSKPGVVLEGPSTKAALIGPDGSHISAGFKGGVVVAPPQHTGAISASVAPGYVAHGYAHAAPAVYSAPAAYSIPVAVPVAHAGYKGYHPLAPGSGLEGQWVPDYTEKLYDDGSYKGEAVPVYGHAYGYGHGWWLVIELWFQGLCYVKKIWNKLYFLLYLVCFLFSFK